MRCVRMTSAVVASLAAMSLFASVTSAQGTEVTEEIAGVHCTVNNCAVHVASEGPVVLELWGDPVSVCDEEFTLHLDENGEGYLSDQSLSGSNCTMTPCLDNAIPPVVAVWGIRIGLWLGATVAAWAVERCLDNAFFGPLYCEHEGELTLNGHEGELAANAEPCTNLGGAVHVTGHWAWEEGSDMEIAEL